MTCLPAGLRGERLHLAAGLAYIEAMVHDPDGLGDLHHLANLAHASDFEKLMDHVFPGLSRDLDAKQESSVTAAHMLGKLVWAFLAEPGKGALGLYSGGSDVAQGGNSSRMHADDRKRLIALLELTLHRHQADLDSYDVHLYEEHNGWLACEPNSKWCQGLHVVLGKGLHLALEAVSGLKCGVMFNVLMWCVGQATLLMVLLLFAAMVLLGPWGAGMLLRRVYRSFELPYRVFKYKFVQRQQLVAALAQQQQQEAPNADGTTAGTAALQRGSRWGTAWVFMKWWASCQARGVAWRGITTMCFPVVLVWKLVRFLLMHCCHAPLRLAVHLYCQVFPTAGLALGTAAAIESTLTSGTRTKQVSREISDKRSLKDGVSSRGGSQGKTKHASGQRQQQSKSSSQQQQRQQQDDVRSVKSSTGSTQGGSWWQQLLGTVAGLSAKPAVVASTLQGAQLHLETSTNGESFEQQASYKVVVLKGLSLCASCQLDDSGCT